MPPDARPVRNLGRAQPGSSAAFSFRVRLTSGLAADWVRGRFHHYEASDRDLGPIGHHEVRYLAVRQRCCNLSSDEHVRDEAHGQGIGGSTGDFSLKRLQERTDRLAAHQAQSLQVHVDPTSLRRIAMAVRIISTNYGRDSA